MPRSARASICPQRPRSRSCAVGATSTRTIRCSATELLVLTSDRGVTRLENRLPDTAVVVSLGRQLRFTGDAIVDALRARAIAGSSPRPARTRSARSFVRTGWTSCS